jgi:dTMP kinase
MALDFVKRNRPAQGLNRGEIDCGPIPLLRSRISIRGTNYFRRADNRFVLAAVIEKDFVTLAHPAKIVAGSVIADACPAGLALRDEVRPRIGRRFLFYQPEIFHVSDCNSGNLCAPIIGGAEILRRRIPAGSRSLPLQARERSTIELVYLTIDMMPRLPFITFEGSEGSGKSTQVQRLAARLEQSGVPYLVTREPGGTAIGESIRELLQFAPHNSSMTPETELLLFEASRSQLVREIIKPALERGVCVIADRFFDSTIAYQGAARKLDRQMVEQLNAFAVGDCVPDATFVLDVDAATTESRMQKPRRPDRMEQQSPEFYERVRQAYRELATHESRRVVLIDGSRSVDEIENQIWGIISARFPALARNLQSAIRNPRS